MKKFDLPNAPLDGVNLIEASAGTGKTHAIAGIYLRLVLEKKLSVDRILVVTFTNAAAKELKDRIRRALRAALAPAEANPEAKALLESALRDFDQSAIFTIHGFCGRVLTDRAFESGGRFTMETASRQTEYLKEISDDFWRKNVYCAPLFLIDYTIKKFGRAAMAGLLRPQAVNPDVKLLFAPPEFSKNKSKLRYDNYLAAFTDARGIWNQSKESALDALRSDGLNGTSYGAFKPDESTGVSKRESTIKKMAAAMEQFLEGGEISFALYENIEKFTSGKIEKSIKKNCVAPSHELFDACQRVWEAAEALEETAESFALNLRIEFFKYVREALPSIKEKNGLQFFDDMILRVRDGLRGAGGGALALALREKYKAALIDEFQDTDPAQYEIFDRVFNCADCALFLIGDPKQAIYSFRGADVFAYMDAAESAGEAKRTLGVNWRSEPNLLGAVNALFSEAADPFVFDSIKYENVNAPPPEDKKQKPLTINGSQEPPFHLWFVRKETDKNHDFNKEEAEDSISKLVAAEIGRLASLGDGNEALIGDEPLKPGDIAVLVRTNRQGRKVSAALTGKNVPSVMCNMQSVFETAEATQLKFALEAAASPGSDRAVKTAAATDIVGMTAEQIQETSESETKWEELQGRFRDYRDLWRRGGFIYMFEALLARENTRARLLQLPDGARRLTNLLHLAELLHKESAARKLGAAGLLKWLSDRIAESGDIETAEEHLLRLETDADAVKIVTMHKSKGLEYPVVFCPFCWGPSAVGGKRGDEPFAFHQKDNESGKHVQALDIGSGTRAENMRAAEREQLAENLRLLYVAVTRAKNRCYLAWGRISASETSALAYLLHRREDTPAGDGVVAELKELMKKKSSDEYMDDLRPLAAANGGLIKLSEIYIGEAPAEKDEYKSPAASAKKLDCRKFGGAILSEGLISSFSSISARVEKTEHAAELPDHDAQAAEPGADASAPEEDSPQSIFSFPRGAKAGVMFHSLFENFDFQRINEPTAGEYIGKILGAHGYDPAWSATVLRMMQNVLTAPLGRPGEEFTLSLIDNKSRRNELEFYFPIRRSAGRDVKAAFEKRGGPGADGGFPEKIGALTFAPARGFMKGFIDMVFQREGRFYLVDWKSNHLGGSIRAYGHQALAYEMRRDFYILQYHIYALALDQYLRSRDPAYDYETRFGGVYYVFLRGVDPKKGAQFGIFHDRPGRALIDDLRAILIDA
ncbi:MAG: exodeoxyribonuclease V subunit beta [bacterium]